MFGIGDLFQEENAAEDTGPDWPELSSGSGSNVLSEKDKVPVSPRLSCGLSGIYNQGATCYLNSLLQTLLMTPEFREGLFQFGPEDLGSLEDKEKQQAKVRVIPIQLQRLFMRLLLLNAQGASTTELTDSFGWTNSEELVQHDVQELNRILFSAIEESLVGTAGESLIRKLYHGTIVNQIVCQECGRTSEREEDFLDLCVAVSGSSGLTESLGVNFVETEALDGKNKYRCEACKKLVNAKKGAKLRLLPPVLTLSLLRFTFDFKKMERIKETTKFVFPKELDMAPYVEKLSTAGITEYELFSVVVHSGGAHGGHYTAYIRDIDSIGLWTHPGRDEIQLPADPASGKVDFIECDSPLELVQVILQKSPDLGMCVDKLCAELVKQTGVSWNKRFKRQHGPINKFLKRHDDKFEFSQDVNWVCLKCPLTDDSEDVIYEASTNRPRPSSPKSPKTNKRPLTPPPPDGHCWFCYNDGRVYPVSTKEIENQYSGRSSAYMLFYRQKNLARPAEASHNKEYMIPSYLIGQICEENVNLEVQRMAYETKVNTITVKLLFPQFFTYSMGALQAKDEAFSFVEHSIDKRKKVTDLFEEIKNQYGDLAPSVFEVNYAKLLPAGVHVYHRLPYRADITIMEAEIPHRCRLFIWDGCQVGGVEIPIGENKEPIKLTVTYGNPCQLTHGFAKTLTMGELRFILGDMTGLNGSAFVLSKVVSQGEETKLLKILPEDHGKTLEEMKLNNGEHLIVESGASKAKSGLAEKAVALQSRIMSFVVENRCGATVDGEWPLTSIEADKHWTVEVLKAAILSIQSVHLFDKVSRLRYEDDNMGLMPPLHEAQTISDAGLKQGLRLVLEPGQAPLTDQLTLTLIPGEGVGEFAETELIAERHMIVGDCLQLMVDKVGKQGDEWHLRKTNWCGEAAEILDDLEVTLADCNLQNGARLLLEVGKLPPKGFFKLPIWLYPFQGQNADSNSGLLAWITGGIQGLLSKSGDTSTESTSSSSSELMPVRLGEIIISKDSTLEELKMMIMTLPSMENVSIPMIEFLRVRLVEQKRLTYVLRHHRDSIRRLKVKSGSTLGVQILQHEETLSNNQVLLDIWQRIPNTKTYQPGQEVIWDTSSGSTPQVLKQLVADLVALPIQRIVLAKYFSEQYKWLEIQDKPNQGKVQKGKKKSQQGKVNLKQAPYQIKDGDVIALKDLDDDPLNQDDFSTDSDIEGRQRLQREAEERRSRREELRKANAAMGNQTYGKRRVEVGIKIHVDNFR